MLSKIKTPGQHFASVVCFRKKIKEAKQIFFTAGLRNLCVKGADVHLPNIALVTPENKSCHHATAPHKVCNQRLVSKLNARNKSLKDDFLQQNYILAAS